MTSAGMKDKGFVMTDVNELKGCLERGKLTILPSKRKKRLMALVWLSEHIPPEREYSEKEFNDLLRELHTFEDPALLRRELYDFGLISRSPEGSGYRLNPKHPSLEDLLVKYCGGITEKPTPAIKTGGNAEYNDCDLNAAANFRNRMHAEALERVRRIIPGVTDVVDRYSVEEYFQQMWDYPGAWYTIVAVPERAGSREALIDTIVRDTIAKYTA